MLPGLRYRASFCPNGRGPLAARIRLAHIVQSCRTVIVGRGVADGLESN